MPDRMNRDELIALAERVEAKAYHEEQLAALFFIAAALFFNAGWPIAGCLMLAKAALDTIGAIGCWMRVHKSRALAGAEQ